jgi:hypothetical protein
MTGMLMRVPMRVLMMTAPPPLLSRLLSLLLLLALDLSPFLSPLSMCGAAFPLVAVGFLALLFLERLPRAHQCLDFCSQGGAVKRLVPTARRAKSSTPRVGVLLARGFDLGLDLLEALLRNGLVRVLEPLLQKFLGDRELAVAQVFVGRETAH